MHHLVALAALVADVDPTTAEPPASGHDWLIGTIVVAALAVISTLVTAVIGYLVKRDTRAVRWQTENEHRDAEYPNQRDELTAVRELVQAVRDDVADVREEQREQRKDLGGVRSEIRSVRDDAGKLRETVDGNAAESRRQHDSLARRLDGHPPKR